MSVPIVSHCPRFLASGFGRFVGKPKRDLICDKSISDVEGVLRGKR
jgi:hypothetical protein